MKSAIFLLLLSISSFSVQAQNLQRKVMFGVGTKSIDAEIAKEKGITNQEALQVTLVVDNSTAAAIGLKVGDLITHVNQQRFHSPEQLIHYVRGLGAGDSIEIGVISNGVSSNRRGIAKGRPIETSEYGEVRYDAVSYELGLLRSIVHIPKNKSGKIPTIFYLQGYPCASQESTPNSKAAGKRLIDDWVKAGYVVYRVERPNMGDSRTSKDCRDTNYEEELASNIAAYKQMLAYDFVDRNNIFLFGHSLGSVTAPLLAPIHQPKGIMVYGVVMRSWFEYFLDINRLQTLHFGDSHLEAERNTRRAIPFFYEWLENGKNPADLAKLATFKELFKDGGKSLNVDGDYVFGRHYSFWHTMNKKHLAEAWSKVTGKVLSIYGEFDVQAINPNDAKAIAAVVNETHPGNGEFLLLPKTDHGLLNAASYQETIASNKSTLPHETENYNPAVGVSTLRWLKKQK
nr:PDZ domain-containing protein [uncultured Undibacterium sp.]